MARIKARSTRNIFSHTTEENLWLEVEQYGGDSGVKSTDNSLKIQKTGFPGKLDMTLRK